MLLGFSNATILLDLHCFNDQYKHYLTMTTVEPIASFFTNINDFIYTIENSMNIYRIQIISAVQQFFNNFNILIYNLQGTKNFKEVNLNKI